MLKSFVALTTFIIFSLFTTAALAADYECRALDGTYHPYSTKLGRFVGEPRFGGFPYLGACEWAISSATTANNGVMCAWNEGGFAPFNLSNNAVVGERDIAYRFLRDCVSVATRTSNGLLCSYTGYTWLSYDIKTGRPTCDERLGYRSFEECYQQISTPTTLSCRWNHFSWQPYHVTTGFIGLERYGFNFVDDCRMTVSMSRKNAVCNWDGVGFRAYDLTTNATLSPVAYGTLRACYASLGE